jgi:osmotically-inducible protein OsmY
MTVKKSGFQYPACPYSLSGMFLTGCLVAASLFLTGCAPTVISSGAAVGTAAAQEKGVTGAWNDTKISSTIKLGLYQKDPDLHRLVSVDVQNAEVFLTGAVPKEEMRLDAVKIAWRPVGVRQVTDNITTSESTSFGTYAQDGWITTQLRNSMLWDEEIQSRNYTVTTFGGKVYLMGIAQNQAELDRVISLARNTRNVSKVVSYVRLKQQDEEEAENQAGEEKEAGGKEDKGKGAEDNEAELESSEVE